MNETTESASMSTKTEEGVHIKGKDAIFLETPKILFPENAPLHNTDKRELYAILDELFQSGAGGGDDWSPPEMPEPDDYEIYLLVEVVDVSSNNASMLRLILASSNGNANTGYGPLKIDWGDGTVDEWNEVVYEQEGYPDYYGWSTQNLGHNYTDVGQYLVKVFGTEHSCFLQDTLPQGGMPFGKIIGAKLGSEIILNDNTNYNTQSAFRGQRCLQYIKMSGKGGLPRTGLYGCSSLKRIDIDIPPQEIYNQQFADCVNLKNFDFSKLKQVPVNGLTNSWFEEINMPKCVSIDESGFYNCVKLRKINAPLCSYVGAGAFTQNYSLENVTFAENCTFGNNCFTSCNLLYPRPDGSTN